MKLKKVLGSFAWVILAAALILINAAAANAEEFSIQEQYAVKETVRWQKRYLFRAGRYVPYQSREQRCGTYFHVLKNREPALAVL